MQKPYKILSCSLFIALIASCGQAPPQYPTSYSNEGFMEYSKKWNKALLEEENQYFENYRRLRPEKTFEKTQAGFYMTPTQMDELRMTQNNDTIRYTYQVKDLQDSIIYDYATIGTKTEVMGKARMTMGLEYALKRMQEGEKATALIPSSLAYGANGDEKNIYPNQPIILEIQLIKNKNR